MRRGPKPTKKWNKGASAGFTAFFAKRAEPLLQSQEEPLPPVEAIGAGLKWIFTSLGNNPRQVSAEIGCNVCNIALELTGTLVALGTGQNPGEGTCEQYWVVDEMEVPESTLHAQRRIRGGTGDLQLRLANGSIKWCTSHHCRPMQPSDDAASEPIPAKSQACHLMCRHLARVLSTIAAAAATAVAAAA
eukprot:CAMPEP_0183339758 /NCGR_PEP_ID=MMETSP0164_2-20130417/6572_1 /TAXON_ID=221442 /ORGANISM="Coccolithus pelagicus ssp braarudi, Strain PLY182g" /LENGTH=188 /DNA_ID=CAMNT_0025509815 /DNA_START=330 /DNA_END=894 /DNA_ORIENTATION=-